MPAANRRHEIPQERPRRQTTAGRPQNRAGNLIGQNAALRAYFADRDDSLRIFGAVRRAVDGIGAADLRVRKSRISVGRGRAFAWGRIPGPYLRGKTAPPALALSFRWRDLSRRWKEIVEPAPGRFTQHLGLFSPAEVDKEVRGWLRKAWAGVEPRNAVPRVDRARKTLRSGGTAERARST